MRNELEQRVHASEERLRFAEAASGVATFDLDLESGNWNWSPQAASLFGLTRRRCNDWEQMRVSRRFAKAPSGRRKPQTRPAALTSNSASVIRTRACIGWRAADKSTNTCRTGPKSLPERRVVRDHRSQGTRSAPARGERNLGSQSSRSAAGNTRPRNSERGRTAVAAEHDLERLVQAVTDAGVELSHAEFGAFFYNVLREDGEAYTLYTLSGAPREAFEKFPMPRNTAIFEPTFRGRPPVRSDDILADPRYGKNAPYHGMPAGHLPVRSYLAASVVSRSGEVLGGLFFGHAQPSVFNRSRRTHHRGLGRASGGCDRQCAPPPSQPAGNRGAHSGPKPIFSN